MSGARVLVVDDDPAILRVVGRYLGANGFSVETLSRAGDVAASVRGRAPDVLLLDLVLPDGDGTAVTAALRDAGEKLPIIVLSAVGDEARKVDALEAGADDYLTKPFGMAELIARVRVALRRSAGLAREPELRAGPLVLDLTSRGFRVGGQPLHLTPKEFEFMRLLLLHQGKLLTTRHLLAEVWGAEYVNDNHILRTLVHQLRRKLSQASPDAAGMILNEPGVGYRLLAPEILTSS